MKHGVVVAHPSADSFIMTVAKTYRDAVVSLGHGVVFRDLYRMGFSPCLQADELPAVQAAPRPDIAEERRVLSDVDVYAFVYPFWFNAPPAILKGYIERVFGLGFGYANGGKPLLGRAQMIVFSSSGAPTEWVVNTGAYEAVRRVADEHFSAVCGLKFLEHVHFGGIVTGLRPDVVSQKLGIVRSTVLKHFGAANCATKGIGLFLATS